MSSPDPVPLPPWPLAAIVTTDGRTLSATDVTSHALTFPEADDVPDDAGVEADDFVAATMAPPATPPRPARRRAPPRAASGAISSPAVTRASRLLLASASCSMHPGWSKAAGARPASPWQGDPHTRMPAGDSRSRPHKSPGLG